MRCAIYTRVSTDEQAMSEYSSLKRLERKPDVEFTWKPSAYLQEAERAFAAFKLNCSWYWCVEHHQAFTHDNLDFYSQMQQEFAEHP